MGRYTIIVQKNQIQYSPKITFMNIIELVASVGAIDAMPTVDTI